MTPRLHRGPALAMGGLALLLAGCTSVPDALPRPQTLEVSGGWTDTNAQSVDPAITAAPWWQALDDPALQRLVQSALESHPDALAAQARLAQAQAALAASSAAARPQLGLGLGADRQGQARRGAGPAAEGAPPRIANRYSLDAQASWEPDLLGRQALATANAQASLEAATSDAAGARQALVAELVLAYVEQMLAQALQAGADDETRWAREALDAAERRRAAGLASVQTVRERDQLLTQAQRSAVQARAAARQAQARLALLAGQQAHRFEPGTLTPALLQPDAPVAAALPAQVLAQRTDVQASWQRLLAVASEADRARLERFPRLTLTTSAGYTSAAFRNWISGNALGWLAGLRLSLPLLDGGRIHAQVQQAQALVLERDAEYRRTVLVALQETQSALAQREAADTELRLATEAHARRVADVDSLRVRLQAGLVDRLALADAERARAQAADELLRAQRARLAAMVALHRALGSPV